MGDWSVNGDVICSQQRRNRFNVGFVNRESKMLRGPIPFILLQHNHPCLSSGSQEQPVSLLVSRAYFQSQNVAIESLCPGEILNSDSYFVKATNRKHDFLLSQVFRVPTLVGFFPTVKRPTEVGTLNN
jgi:hypothetical protein